MTESKYLNYIIIFLILVLIANVAYLDFSLLKARKDEQASLIGYRPPTTDAGIGKEEEQPKSEKKTEEKTGDDKQCSLPCLTAIKEATASLSLKTETVTKQETIVQQVATPTLKINYIPLGSATVKSLGLWKDTGAQTYLDLVDYPKAKSVYFEASLSVPSANGRGFARLFNVTDNTEVWNSEIWVESAKPTLVSSVNPINISSANKLYRVQIKTTMDFEAVMDSARLKIVY